MRNTERTPRLYLNILHRGVLLELPHALRVGEQHVADPLGVQVPEPHVVARRLDDHVVEPEPAHGELPGLLLPAVGPLRRGRRLDVAPQRGVEVLDDADPPRQRAVGRHAEDLGSALGLAAGAEGAGRLGRLGAGAGAGGGARVGRVVGLEVGGAARARRREDDPPPEHGVPARLRDPRSFRHRLPEASGRWPVESARRSPLPEPGRLGCWFQSREDTWLELAWPP